MRRPERNVDIKKATAIALVTNILQVVLVVGIAAYVLLSPKELSDMRLTRWVVCIAAIVVAWGAAVDIREALSTRKILSQIDDMDTTIGQMEDFNNTLRSQRHDFLNHLQVVYSLIEMQEYEEANAYIDKVYGAITSVSRVIKTANPAINALLTVKSAACEKAGVKATVSIQSSWKHLPMQGWEMCKVLSNLIDNAIDALREIDGERRLDITLTEDVRSYRFTVSNNGPMIPLKIQQNIFLAGVTTKSSGHGMGLFIAQKTLRDRGGDLTLVSTAEKTEFSGFVPKDAVLAHDGGKTAE